MDSRKQFLDAIDQHAQRIDQITDQKNQLVENIKLVASSDDDKQQKLAGIRNIENRVKQAKREINIELRSLKTSYDAAINEIKNVTAPRDTKTQARDSFENAYRQVGDIYQRLKTDLDGILVETADIKQRISADENISFGVAPEVAEFMDEQEQHVELAQKMLRRYGSLDFEMNISSREDAEKALAYIQNTEELIARVTEKIDAALTRLETKYAAAVTATNQNPEQAALVESLTATKNDIANLYQNTRKLYTDFIPKLASGRQQIEELPL